MKKQLYRLLESKAISEREEAITTIKLLTEHPAGIGDHSTDDFYNNAEQALQKLVDAEDKLSTLEKFKIDLFSDYEKDRF
tara:strand:- start:278 stop:517 length:240 start_codon:yes stop_codon:yes gene_type:complete